ncbi:uncharacterized protein LOC128551331 [Mercenaria mercenaria]|uniref:uncharacterized protein LOC128551331 n=1 Tax=Mercenaria mercenaria TaxID=6596 RepID=UPI00234F53B8|nr:uncharacterized protein LOC128551331 [Mercenaria mercenaria]
MATGGGYTVDNESFCRLYRFVCEIVPKPIRRLLENNSPKGNVQNLLRNSNTQIQIMRTKGILQNQQYMLLHPPPGKVFDIKDWDVTLLCNIVKNVCNIKNRSIKVALEDLRNERNKLSHCSAPELTLADFNVRWTAVETSLKVITKSLNDQAFETAINDEYNNVKTGPVSVQPIFDILKTHIHVYQNVKTS